MQIYIRFKIVLKLIVAHTDFLIEPEEFLISV